MTTHQIIYAWGDFGPDSVTGQWGANTYPDGAEPFVPLAAIAAAYEDAAKVADNESVTARKYPEEAVCETYCTDIADTIRSRTPADALAALERELRKARNEALEAAAAYFTEHAYFTTGGKVGFEKSKFADGDKHHAAIAAAIRAMKEPEE